MATSSCWVICWWLRGRWRSSCSWTRDSASSSTTARTGARACTTSTCTSSGAGQPLSRTRSEWQAGTGREHGGGCTAPLLTALRACAVHVRVVHRKLGWPPYAAAAHTSPHAWRPLLLDAHHASLCAGRLQRMTRPHLTACTGHSSAHERGPMSPAVRCICCCMYRAWDTHSPPLVFELRVRCCACAPRATGSTSRARLLLLPSSPYQWIRRGPALPSAPESPGPASPPPPRSSPRTC